MTSEARRVFAEHRQDFAYHGASMESCDFFGLLRDLGRRLDDNLSLAALATRTGWSRFHLHRSFHRLAADTPMEHTQRAIDRPAHNLRDVRKRKEAL
jgi:AraC-like DNA-binding protein